MSGLNGEHYILILLTTNLRNVGSLVVRGGLEPLTRTNFSMKLSIYVKCKS